MVGQNKLECLTIASVFSLVYYLQVRPGAEQSAVICSALVGTGLTHQQ
jgi:hypothetical protein